MPTIITHAAPVLASGIAVGRRRLPMRLFWLAVVCSMLPDFDVAGFLVGVRYADLLGHRGFSHSLLFAALCGGAAALAAPLLRCRRRLAAVVAFLAVASHIFLDALTSGGLGVAAFWPFDEGRFFLPWRPIRVSPFNPRAFASARGIAVILSELRWVWLPCFIAAGGVRLWLEKKK
ncbi:MAG: metal-dependent hydrolase [Acidobacteriota bacterium]|jgi:inner membrane protein|nr:metal-dependent hydrolase [Acidobacteriota bacterium]